MTRIRRVQLLRALLAGAIGALALGATAQAQQVYWQEADALGAGQRAALDLVFSGTQPAGRVTPPHVDGLTVLGPPSEASNISIINGRQSASVTLSFPVRAEREGKITIPSFEVDTAAGRRSVAALTVAVGEAVVPGAGSRGASAQIGDVVEARLTPANMTPYAGEVFDVDVTVGLNEGRRGQVVGTPTWDQPGVVAAPWGEGHATRDGSAVRFHTRAVAAQPGRVTMAPVQQEVQIESGRPRVDPFADMDDAFGAFRKLGPSGLFDSFFSRGQMTSATVKSNAVQLDVRPLPQPAPAGFSGAVGQFELESSIAPEQPKTGEPITWTLTLKGAGNWPGAVELPARAVPSDFRTLQPKQHKDFTDGELFNGALSEDLVLVPNRPGDYTLEPVRFVYFDPAAGQYRTIEARPPALHVTGAPVVAQPQPHAQPAAPAVGAAPANRPANPPIDAAAHPGNGAVLPHDPLPGAATGFTPIASTSLWVLAATPVALVVLYWLALALQQAWRTDPRRPQREALKRLRPAIERVRSAGAADERIAALLAWQRTAVVALGIDLAAPTATQLPDPRWTDAWRASERALYGRGHELPAGWGDRALALCTRARRPRFNPLRLLAIRQVVPKAAAAGLLIALVATHAHADPLAAYQKGDFSAAQDELLARVKQVPADWAARYDLGLVHAQLGDAPRALGETVAAFVHAPRHADVRWNAQAFAGAVAGIDRSLAALVAAPGLSGLAAPATWQTALIAAALLSSIGAALVLRRRYRARLGVSRWGTALLALGLLLGGGAAFSLHTYGPLADPRAALVAGQPVLRSVPTDAEPAPQQRALPAGTLVVVERDFLGWVKVGLRDGETGWVRHGDLVPLYEAPSA